ncbi:MAG: hypothetical protein D6701_12915 [Gemmatimonadetes bacterium]|nr:MAG: hypothetical protein D6701_12915 [Gemmatimonadota bacterium]
MSPTPPLDTLEPLIDAVREGIESAGWPMSGLQKTTSREFEGRWDGEDSRSAYLFFHRDDLPEGVAVEGFLDETSDGLRANLSLVVDLPPLDRLGDARALLAGLSRVVGDCLPEDYRTPFSLRLSVAGPGADPARAAVQARLKLRVPAAALRAGAGAVQALAATTARAFERALAHPELALLVREAAELAGGSGAGGVADDEEEGEGDGDGDV